MKSIFVSSTFRDMNFERDVLNRHIAPKINHLLQRYNQTIRILDLRWGIDTSDMTEQEASDRVLSVCFDAINNCKPYFVVLIGDRYGYIPENSNRSVTHMEILRGALERTDKDHIYIYFRDADYSDMPEEFREVYIEKNEDSRCQLKQLTDSLLQEMPQCCRRYTAKWDAHAQCLISEDFEQIILTDLKEDIVKSYQGICYRSALHKQLSENEETLTQNSLFAYRDKQRINADVCSILQSDHPWALVGTAGAGKSVYMSLLCSTLRSEKERAHILFCGDDVFSASARNAAEAVLYALLNSADREYDYVKYAAMSYAELISNIMQVREIVTGKVYIFLDAVDKCDQGMMDFVFWCDSFLKEQMQLVISSRDTQEIADHKESLHISHIQYTIDDYRQMANRILEKNGKQINSTCIELAITKIQTPLQLQLLLMRLIRLDAKDFALIQQSGGGIDQINSHLTKIIESSPTETGGLVAVYLQELLGERKDPVFYLFLLNLLAFCEYGLQEDDLRALFDLANQQWTELEYVDFLERYTFFVRIRENGRLDLSHDIIRHTLRKLLTKNGQQICFLLAIYLLNREHQDSLSIRSFFNVAFIGKQQKVVVEFAKKYKGYLSSIDKMELGMEIRRSVQNLFFKDGGKFLLNIAASCDEIDGYSAFYAMLSSSLLTIDDYNKKEDVVQIAYTVAAVAIPLLQMLKGNLLQMEIDACKQFLQKNNIGNDVIEKFMHFCQKQMSEGKKEGSLEEKELSLEALFESMHRASGSEKTMIWMQLFQITKQMETDTEQAPVAEQILCELLPLAQSGLLEYENDMRQMLLGELYSCFGAVYKTMQQWEKGLDYDRKSRDIYQKLYEERQSQDLFRKYCNKVYNIANITEAWAMSEINNIELWEETRLAYEDAYAVEVVNMAVGVSERRVIKAASVILSLGTALVNTGRHEEGMKKYKEGIALIHDSAKNHADIDIYLELCLHMFECVYQLMHCKKMAAAYELSKDINPQLLTIIHSGENASILHMKKLCDAFSNQINKFLSQLLSTEDAQEHLVVARMASELYETLLPVASFEDKTNLIISKCNMCSILMFGMHDYELAYQEYKHLLELVVKEDLVLPDKNGKYIDQVNSRLIDAYSRILLCLEKLDRQDEVKEWVNNARSWAEYFSKHLDADQGDTPKVLYQVFHSLHRNGSALSFIFLMMAFSAAMEEGYDQEAHSDTVMRILTALSQMKHGEEEEE
ncbi:MAG: DUF4062 domain-containing protein [Ruminococcaceae bacterium]|nr:DUF4062 domain-containing protein [Oscillospiraceae bacterium]